MKEEERKKWAKAEYLFTSAETTGAWRFCFRSVLRLGTERKWGTSKSFYKPWFQIFMRRRKRLKRRKRFPDQIAANAEAQRYQKEFG